MLKKIVKFAKYNSLVVAVIAVAFVAVASAMADEDVKNKIIGEEIIEKSGVDNTALLAADLENFDMEMKITNAMEDPPEAEDGNYYIDYQYKTLAIKDSVWQEVLIAKQMTVSKRSLEGRDLGLYVTEELGEIIDYQLAYLKEVQENEADKGVTVVLETTEYTGLIGLVLDTKTKELPGYEPVIQPEVAEVADLELGSEISSGYPELSSDESSYDDFLGAPEDNDYPEDAPVWEQMENNCLNGGGFWYNETCNAEAEPPPTSSPEHSGQGEKEETETEEPVSEEPPEEEEPAEEEEEEPPVSDEPASDDAAEEPEPEMEPETETETGETS